MASTRICVFAPVPPPLVGSSYAVQLLLESRFSQSFDIEHIDTSYASSVADLGKFRIGKVVKLVRYLVRLAFAGRRARIILITPAFSRGPFLKDSLAILVASWLTSARIVLWANNNDLTPLYRRSGKLMRRYIRYVLSRADHVVTVGNSLRDQFRPFVRDDQISAIPNGLPDVVGAHRVAPDGRVRVLYLSNMHREKGWQQLLDAAMSICAAEPSAEFDFYGAPAPDSPKEEIERAFAMAGNGRIRYHGPVTGEPKLDALRRTDIFCLPTMYPTEALPLSILEAFRHGAAVVSTPIGAIPDAVVDGEGGALIPKADGPSLVRALRRLIAEPETRKRMGAFNRRRFEEQYTMDRIAGQWIGLIGRLATEGSRS